MGKEIPITELLQTEELLKPEKCIYDAFIQENNVGSFVIETKSLGGGQWEFISTYSHYKGAVITSAVTVEGKGLMPISTHKVHKTPSGRISLDAQYHDDRLELMVTKPTGLDHVEIPLSGPTFDNDEILPLLRYVNWEEEMESHLDGIIVDNGRKYFAWLTALKQEEKECGLGMVNAWMVRIIYDTGVSQNSWYGVDLPHHLVRYENSQFQLTLKSCDG